MKTSPVISVVVPCYNEYPNIEPLRQRFQKLPLFEAGQIEVVAVDDGSIDHTWDAISNWARESPNVVAVNLAGNHGNQIAILSGIHTASGSAVGVVDADLQDPPELLLEMLNCLGRDGASAIIGVKRTRADHKQSIAILKSLATSLLPYRPGEGDFCVMRKEIARATLRRGSLSTPFRTRRQWALKGHTVLYFPYDRDFRRLGSTHFSLPQLALLWLRLASCSIRMPAEAEFIPPIQSIVREGFPGIP